MTLTIDLPDEPTVALTARARAQGMSAEEYARQVLEHDLGASGPRRRHISEVIRDNMRKVPPEIMAAMPKDGAPASTTTTSTGCPSETVKVGFVSARTPRSRRSPGGRMSGVPGRDSDLLMSPRNLRSGCGRSMSQNVALALLPGTPAMHSCLLGPGGTPDASERWSPRYTVSTAKDVPAGAVCRSSERGSRRFSTLAA